jgi:hypothetical protein
MEGQEGRIYPVEILSRSYIRKDTIMLLSYPASPLLKVSLLEKGLISGPHRQRHGQISSAS